MSKIKAISVSTLCFLVLSGCTTVGPDYHKPETKISDQWNTDNLGVKTTPTQDATWWKSFNDPILNHLIEVGYRNNLTLQSVGANVLQARAQLAQSVGELYPQQQAITGNYTRQRINNSNQYAGIVPTNFETDTVSISASWEPDFWGKYRRAIKADDATFLASIAAYDDALVSLTADIGSSYVAIRAYQAQIATAKKSIVALKQSLELMQTRYHNGQVNLSDVEQTRINLNQAEANLPTLNASLQQEKDALAVLLGTTPDQVDALLQPSSKTTSAIPIAAKNIAVGIPKDVLRQRPDVYQAELEAIANSEGIGAIKAQLYPAFTLNGSFGYSSSNAGQSSTNNLFQWSNHTYSVGPSLSIPIFNYGQITNQVRQQDAAFQASIFNYQNTVLNAQKEVQDSITSYVEAEKTLSAMVTANNAALENLHLTQARYEVGEVDYSDVLNAEINQLNIQATLINAQSSVPQNAISLYRALGGGWQIRQGHDVVSDQVKQQMRERTNWGDLLTSDHDQAPKNKTKQIEQTWMPDW